ncbi:MAG: hypothetical protein K2I69_03675 [Muribaculaceae bacterium]|nr:hypothetical protein [Muribaculaceae bacterium]MDE6573697.1 hypothetical protein [Muribaculaceae bacterium]
MKKLLSIIMLCSACADVCAENSVFSRICSTDTLFDTPVAAILENPVFADMRTAATLTDASAGYRHLRMSQAPVAAEGEGYGSAFFKASTFIRTANGAIGGFAGYNNDRRYNIQCNETSDAALLYPYLTADSVGGDMRSERYSFGAFYNGHSRRLHYGVSINYTALQEYRSIDPRPKNTSSRPGITLGCGYETAGYRFAIGLEASKYKQSNSIKFVSELGEAKIYHLSGLGIHYVRFSGNSKQSAYNGWSRGISLNMAPVKSGMAVRLNFNRFTFNKILSDINNLPLARSRRDVCGAVAGYRSGSFSISGLFNFCEQLGAENIFGSPQGNVYPEIASLQSFRRRDFIYGVQTSWRTAAASGYWTVAANAGCTYSMQNYLATVPERSMEINAFGAGAEASWKKAVSDKILLQAGTMIDFKLPFGCGVDGIENSSQFIISHLFNDYRMASSRSCSAGVNFRADYSIKPGLAIGINTQYAYNTIESGTHGNYFAVGAILSF